MNRSDGSTAAYYELPEGCGELQDLISHRDMNAQIGEVFRACYRYGIASHSDRLRDAKKIKFYAEAEIKRLQMLDAAAIEPAAAMEDDSPRMQAIGQNGELGEEIYPALDGWIKWEGGECPVPFGTLIDTRHRDGQERIGSKCGAPFTRTACGSELSFWRHEDDDGAEIIAYKIHKEA